MTKYTTINRSEEAPKKKTVFTAFLGLHWEIDKNPGNNPDSWNNVLFIGNHRVFGDVFKAWDYEGDDFTIYFGEKGDEFED